MRTTMTMMMMVMMMLMLMLMLMRMMTMMMIYLYDGGMLGLNRVYIGSIEGLYRVSWGS